MKKNRPLWSASAFALVFAAAASANAQQVDEIIVTATKQNENQQDVPVAVTTVTAEALDNQGITSTQELGQIIPNLVVTREASSQTTFLRGVGTGSAAAGQEPSVAYYVDGVYNPSPTSSAMSFNNIERIEVLRGPQGTLFGRNTTGGVIQVVTKDPSHTPTLSADLSYGNFNATRARFYGAAGLTDSLAADLAVYYSEQTEGYGRNLFLNKDRAGEQVTSLRTKWLWTPTANTEVRASLSYSDSDSSLGVDRHAAPGAYLITFGPPVTAPADFQDVSTNFFNHGQSEQWAGYLNIKHHFDGVDFTSITAYRDDSNAMFFDQDGTALRLVDVSAFWTAKTFSQELLLSSNDAASKLKWTLGVFYFSYDAAYDPVHIVGLALPVVVDVLSEQQSTSYAVYGQASYAITDKTALTFGARFSQDTQELSGQTNFNGAALAGRYETFPGFDPKVTDEEPTYRLGVDHHFNDNVMTYASYNHSYKTGTFNLVIASGVPAPPVNPEIIDAYEVGVKSELFDRRLRLNAAAFYYDFSDLQLVTQVAGGQVTRNAAAAEIYGSEFELSFAATEHFSLDAAVSLLQSKYLNFLNGPKETPNPPSAGGNTPSTANFSGNSLVRAPEFTFNGTARYVIPTEIGNVESSLTLHYNDGFFWDAENRLAQPSFTILNAQVRWVSSNGRYNVGVWGNNLTDEEYATFGNAEALGDQLAPAPPRTYGVSLGVDF